jgi:hypothetical protein
LGSRRRLRPHLSQNPRCSTIRRSKLASKTMEYVIVFNGN